MDLLAFNLQTASSVFSVMACATLFTFMNNVRKHFVYLLAIDPFLCSLSGRRFDDTKRRTNFKLHFPVMLLGVFSKIKEL